MREGLCSSVLGTIAVTEHFCKFSRDVSRVTQWTVLCPSTCDAVPRSRHGARPTHNYRIKTYPLLQPRHMAARWRLEAVPFAESIFLDNRSPPAHIARVPRPVTSSGSSAFLDPLAGFGKRVNRFPTLEFPPSAFPTREGYWQPRPTTTLHSARAPQANRLEGSPLLFSYRTPRSAVINVTTSGRVPRRDCCELAILPRWSTCTTKSTSVGH